MTTQPTTTLQVVYSLPRPENRDQAHIPLSTTHPCSRQHLGNTVEKTLVSIRSFVDKQAVVPPYNGSPLIHKHEGSADTCYLSVNLRTCQVKDAHTRGRILYDSFSMRCRQQRNPSRQEAEWGLPGTLVTGGWGVTGCFMGTGFCVGVMEIVQVDGGGA